MYHQCARGSFSEMFLPEPLKAVVSSSRELLSEGDLRGHLTTIQDVVEQYTWFRLIRFFNNKVNSLGCLCLPKRFARCYRA